MDNKKKRTINKQALGRICGATCIILAGGVVYYVTAWKVKNDIIRPALAALTEAADEFLTDWSGSSDES